MRKPTRVYKSERIAAEVMKTVEQEKVPPAEILAFVLASLTDDELYRINSEDGPRAAVLFTVAIRPLWEGRTDRTFEAEQSEVARWGLSMVCELVTEELRRAGLAKRETMPDTAGLFKNLDSPGNARYLITGKDDILPRLSPPAERLIRRLMK